MLLNFNLQEGNCYFEGDGTSSMHTKLTGVLEEKENAAFTIICGFEQPQPSTSPHIYFWLVQ
jgi:hypothetical protein